MSAVSRSCFLSLVMFLVLAGLPKANAAEPASTDQKTNVIDEEVLEIFNRSMDHLAKLKQFQVTAEFGFDVLQETGQKIEFGSRQNVTIQRPNHFRVDFVRRDGVHGSVVYDGKEVVLSHPEEAVYAKAPFKGEIDDALDFLAEELQRPIPLRDFFVSDPGSVLTAKIESGIYVDESMLAGVLCDHLAMRNDNVDFQIWIPQGDEPLPRRIIITFKNEEGQPQFWGQFLKWETSPKLSDETFTYTPSEKVERIPFAVVDVEMQSEGGQP